MGRTKNAPPSGVVRTAPRRFKSFRYYDSKEKRKIATIAWRARRDKNEPGKLKIKYGATLFSRESRVNWTKRNHHKTARSRLFGRPVVFCIPSTGYGLVEPESGRFLLNHGLLNLRIRKEMFSRGVAGEERTPVSSPLVAKANVNMLRKQ